MEEAECPTCGAVVPITATECPECGEQFAEEEEEAAPTVEAEPEVVETGEPSAEDEFTEVPVAEEKPVPPRARPAAPVAPRAVPASGEKTLDEEREEEEKKPGRALFFVGVIITIIAMGAAGGSELHNTLGILGSNWEAYGPLDQMTGIAGSIVLIIGIVIMAIALKRMKSVEEEETQCPECGAMLSVNEMKCPDCGIEFAS